MDYQEMLNKAIAILRNGNYILENETPELLWNGGALEIRKLLFRRATEDKFFLVTINTITEENSVTVYEPAD